MEMDLDVYDPAHESLRDALRQVAVHGESDAICDAAEAALDGLDLACVLRAMNATQRYRDTVVDAFLVAVRSGVFDVRF